MTTDEADRCGPPVLVFEAEGLPGFRFQCRSMARTPPDGTVAFMYRRRDGVLRQGGAVVFVNGAWRRKVNGDPIEAGEHDLWTAMVDA